ncbi:MAG: hypothetical protein V4726_05800 [Verrucomicrobiota bacterium]
MTTTTAPAPWRTTKPAPAAVKPAARVAPPVELQLIPAEPETEIESAAEAVNESLLPRADTAVILTEFQSKIESLRRTAETLNVTDITDLAGQKLARETRLQIRQIRIASDKKREGMVDGMTKEVRRINAGFKEIWDGATRLEKRLQEQEDFIEIETARLEDERRTARSNEIRPYLTSFPAVDLGKITEDEYQAVLSDARDLRELKLAREAKEKADRLAKEKEEADQRERDRLENDRLRDEAAALTARNLEIQQRADAARKEADEKLRRQQAEANRKLAEARRQKQEADKRESDRAEAERQRIDAEAEAARKAAAAPDREKLTAFAAALAALPLPQLSPAAGHISDWLSARLRVLGEQIAKSAADL